MESETSGTPDDTSFTHKAKGWDDAASPEGMTSDQNVRGWDWESGDAFRIHLEMPADDVSSEDEGFSPSYKDLSLLPKTRLPVQMERSSTSIPLKKPFRTVTLCPVHLMKTFRQESGVSKMSARPSSSLTSRLLFVRHFTAAHSFFRTFWSFADTRFWFPPRLSSLSSSSSFQCCTSCTSNR